MKKMNEYARLFAEYDRTSKAVYAAIAFSLAMQVEGEEPDLSSPFGVNKIRERVKAEWEALWVNGIVPQRPIPTAEA